MITEDQFSSVLTEWFTLLLCWVSLCFRHPGLGSCFVYTCKAKGSERLEKRLHLTAHHTEPLGLQFSSLSSESPTHPQSAYALLGSGYCFGVRGGLESMVHCLY